MSVPVIKVRRSAVNPHVKYLEHAFIITIRAICGDQAQVVTAWTENTVMFEVITTDDISSGRLIGKNGETAESIRALFRKLAAVVGLKISFKFPA